MDIIVVMLIGMILLVPFAFLLFQAFRRVKCPDCSETLPVFYSPFKKSRRMWRAGGYLCARCGCETNMAGQKVSADTPPAPFPTLQWALLAIGLLAGVGLGASLIVVGAATPPPAAAAPPVVELPQQAPAVVPVN